MSTATTLPEPSTTSTCTDRRAAANRRNAQKSTGPRTPEGKARSSLNAVKTGCFARTPLIPGEEPEELQAFIDEIIDDLFPQGPIERDLAERVAGLSWRRRRLWRAEEEVIANEFGPPMDEEEEADLEEEMEWAERDGEQHRQDSERQAELDGQAFLARQFAEEKPGPLARLANHERRLSGSIDAALRMLMKVRDARRKASPPAPNEAIESGREPLLTPARRAELPPESPVAPPAPNEAITDPTGTQPSGLALKGGAPDPTPSAVQNEAIASGREPLLTAARRAEFPPESPVALAAPNEAITVPTGTQPCGLALKGGAPDPQSLSARNEPIASRGAAPGGLVQRDAGGFKWGDVAAAAAAAVVRQGRQTRSTGR